MAALEELVHLSSGVDNRAILDWKKKGNKVFGYFCSYVPEEVLCAANILPYRIRARGCTQTAEADVYYSRLNCSFARSCLQYALENKYGFLDGIVFTQSCDHIRRLYDILRVVRPAQFAFMHFLDVPRKTDDESIAWYRDEIITFRQHLEESLGVKITDAKLRDAIRACNETRSLLKRLYQLRCAKKPPLTGAQTLSIVLAATMTPKAEYNGLLKGLLDELGEGGGISQYRARLMISGSGGCDNPDYLRVMEDLGGLVVTDSLCLGSRYFWFGPVDVKGDLMGNLARSYLGRPSCGSMVDGLDARLKYVQDMVSLFNVDGVVFQHIRYCDLWGGQISEFARTLKELGVPMLSLEREYQLGATGQLRTRVQAFLEMIGGN